MSDGKRKAVLLAVVLVGLPGLIAGFAVGRLTVKPKIVQVPAEPVVEKPSVFWAEDDPGEVRLRKSLQSSPLPGRLQTSRPTITAPKNEITEDPLLPRVPLEPARVHKEPPGLPPTIAPAVPPLARISDEPSTLDLPLPDMTSGLPPPGPLSHSNGPNLAEPLDVPLLSGRAKEGDTLQPLDIRSSAQKLLHPVFSEVRPGNRPLPERFDLMPEFAATQWSLSQRVGVEGLRTASSQTLWPGALPEASPKPEPHNALAAREAWPTELVRKKPGAAPQPEAPKASPEKAFTGLVLPVRHSLPGQEAVLSDLRAPAAGESVSPSSDEPSAKPAFELPVSQPLRPESPNVHATLAEPVLLKHGQKEEAPGLSFPAAWRLLSPPRLDFRRHFYMGSMPGLFGPANLRPAPAPEEAVSFPFARQRSRLPAYKFD